MAKCTVQITNMAIYILAYKTCINNINEHISVSVYVTVNKTYLAKGIEFCIYNSLHNYKHIEMKTGDRYEYKLSKIHR